MKGIDAVTREQLVQIMAALGLPNVSPVFSMVPSFGPIKPAALLPTVTEEDRVILNNVRTVVEFLTAGSSISRTSNQVIGVMLFNLLNYGNLGCAEYRFLVPSVSPFSLNLFLTL